MGSVPGLDRGFLAEVRAWSETVRIYEEGLREGLWNAIDWMDTLLKTKLPGQSYEAFLIQALDSNFEDQKTEFSLYHWSPVDWPICAKS